MKRRVLLKRLSDAAKSEGETLEVTEGAGHSKVTIGTRSSVVPRHNEINEITARGDPQADGSRPVKVTARARRSDGWWAVDVPEIPGVFTQVRRLDQVPGQVADAVATMLDNVAAADIEVSLDARTALVREVEQALVASEEAAAAQARASELMREVVHGLRVDEELSVRDVATLLGVSHQRVSQLSG